MVVIPLLVHLFLLLAVVTWAGKSRRVLPTGVRREADLMPGGLAFNSKLVFMAIAADFLDSAAETVDGLKTNMVNTGLTYLGGAYKCTAVDILPGGLMIQATFDAVAQM